MAEILGYFKKSIGYFFKIKRSRKRTKENRRLWKYPIKKLMNWKKKSIFLWDALQVNQEILSKTKEIFLT